MAADSWREQTEGSPVYDLTREPKNADEWVALVQNTYSYLRPFKANCEKHWSEACLFIAGEQWVSFNPVTRQFNRHNLDSWIPTPVTNLLLRHYDRVRDILTNNEWMPRARPASDDQADIDAAIVATRSLHHLYRALHTGNLHAELAAWLVLTGNCFAYANWDPRSGLLQSQPRQKVIEEPVEEPIARCDYCAAEHPPAFTGQVCPTCGQGTLIDDVDFSQVTTRRDYARDAEGHIKYRRYRQGEVCEGAANPFNLYVQPRDHWDKVMYVDEVVPFDLDELVATFGSKARKVNAEDVRALTGGGLQPSRAHYFNRGGEAERSMCLVHYFRHKPMDYADDVKDGKFKKGKYIIVANGVMLHEGDLDTIDGLLPYAHGRYRVLPGELWGIGPMVDMIPQQKRINAIDSHIILNRKTMLSPQWTVPQGSGVTFIDGRPGLLIRYNPHNTGGAMPRKEQGMPLPASIIQERDATMGDLERVGGTLDVLTGEKPPGVEAGVALNHLTEQAYRRFGNMVRDYRNCLIAHEERKLRIVRAKWSNHRLIKVVGDNEEVEAFHYRGADLGSTTDVFMDLDRGILQSEAAKEQKLTQAASQGWLGDLRDPKVRGPLLEKLGVPGFETEYTIDAKKARRVLMKLKRGEDVPPPLPTDVHPIQFQVIADYTKTSEFEQLPEDVQQRILERANMHQQAMQQQAAQSMQAAEAAKGTSDAISDRIAESGAMPGGPPASVQQVAPV